MVVEDQLIHFTWEWYDWAVMAGAFLIAVEAIYFKFIKDDIKGNFYTPKTVPYTGNKFFAILIGGIATAGFSIPYVWFRETGLESLKIINGAVIVVLAIAAVIWFGNMRLGKWYAEREVSRRELADQERVQKILKD